MRSPAHSSQEDTQWRNFTSEWTIHGNSQVGRQGSQGGHLRSPETKEGLVRPFSHRVSESYLSSEYGTVKE